MPKILAIDAGGTSTRALLLDPSGQCLGYGVSGGGNPISAGRDGAFLSLRASIRGAFSQLPPASRHAGFCLLAMAGATAATAADGLPELLAEEGLIGKVVIEPDLLATFFSGTYHIDGYALVAGTGAVGASIRSGALDRISDGLGWLLGDAGSGYWIGHQVVRAVGADLDGRGPATAMTGTLLSALEMERQGRVPVPGRPAALQELLDHVYAMPPVRLARFAPLAFAADGDGVADAILASASGALAATLASVRTASRATKALPIVLGGSVLGSLAALPDTPLAQALLEAASDGAEVLRVPDGMAGAAVLSLLRSGYRVGEEVFERITRSLAQLR